MMWEPKIGDWIRPEDDVVDGIAHGYNLRLIIKVPNDWNDGAEFTTVCDAYDGREKLWHIYNCKFVARIDFGE